MLTVHTQIAQLSTPDLIIAETDRSAQNGGSVRGTVVITDHAA